MKIHTRTVWQMTDDPGEFILLEDDAYDYEGPVAEAGGGKGGGGKSVTTTEPSKLVQPFIAEALPGLADAFQSRLGRDMHAGPSAVPGFDPYQIASQMGLADYAQSPGLANQIGQAQGALGESLGLPGQFMQGDPFQSAMFGSSAASRLPGQFFGSDPFQSSMGGISAANRLPGQLMGGEAFQGAMGSIADTSGLARDFMGSNPFQSSQSAMDFALNLPQNIASDPTVQAQIGAAQRPLVEQFQNQIMPSIGGDALSAGGFGGSRQGVAEGIAAKGLTDALGDVSTGIQSDAFRAALQNQMQGIGQAQGFATDLLGAQNVGAGNLLDFTQGALGNQMQGIGQALGFGSDALRNQTAAGGQQLDFMGDLLQNQMRGLALAPGTLGLGTMPSDMLGQIGAQRQGQLGALLGEQRGDFQFAQQANDPMNLYTQYLNTLVAPGFGNTQNAQGPSQSRLASGLGGAATGGALGSMIPGFGAGAGTLLGPAGLAGMALGGALGLFG